MPDPTFLTIFGIADPDQTVTKVAVEAVRKGYAVVPLPPGSKKPTLCTLNAQELKAAGPDHPCGVHHALTTDRDVRRVFTRLQKAYGALPLGLGVVAYPSRLVVVDADNAVSVAAFLRYWADQEGDDGYLTHSPTVKTPGMVDDEGTWVHKDGGHFYFRLPDGVDLDLGKGLVKDKGGFDIRWGWSMTAVPPTTRPEGPYVATGHVLTAPDWLIERIVQANAEYVERRTLREVFHANDGIASWSQSVSWSDLLEPDGWTDTSKTDRCGCPIFEKPGGGSTSWKSATGHEADCDRYENIEGHGPLHLWTTDPPAPLDAYVATNGQTVTKLRYVALTQHDDDVEAAKSALGIEPAASEAFKEWFDTLPDESPALSGTRGDSAPDGPAEGVPVGESQSQSPSTGNQGTQGLEVPDGLRDSADESQHPEGTRESPGRVTDDAEDDADARPRSFWLPHEESDDRSKIVSKARDLYFAQRAKEYLAFKMAGSIGADTFSVSAYGDAPARRVEPDVGLRIDGVPLLYRGRVNTIFGPSEAGKSWFGVACLADVVARGGRVLFIDVEDDFDGFTLRLSEVGVAPGAPARYVRLWAMPSETDKIALIEMAKHADLVVVDSFDGLLAMMGHDVNHAGGVRAVGTLLKHIATVSGAALLLVDHSSEKVDTRQQMGSSAKKQFIDGATYYAQPLGRWRKGAEGRTLILAGKDRHGWAKTHALFDKDGDDWGRMALLRIQPNWPDGDGYDLAILTPPDFTAEPGHSATDLQECEDLILDFLRAQGRKGEWQSQTACFKAGGDKNGRGVQPSALTHLTDLGAIERREVPVRGGRTGIEYRYLDLDAPSPESPDSHDPGPGTGGTGTRDDEEDTDD